MHPVNPWQSPEACRFEPKVRMKLGRKLFLVLCVGAWVLFFALLGLQSYLARRYPGLRDNGAGPADYWPMDVCSVATDIAAFVLLFALAVTLTFIATRHSTGRSQPSR